MSKRKPVVPGLVLAIVAAALAALAACEAVPLTSSPGTNLTLIANPEFVAANGGRSLVTAILVEPAGTFVPDGTEVFLVTNLGQIEASAKTVNGVARAWFVADSRSGRATVTAISGGPAPAPAAPDLGPDHGPPRASTRLLGPPRACRSLRIFARVAALPPFLAVSG